MLPWVRGRGGAGKAGVVIQGWGGGRGEGLLCTLTGADRKNLHVIKLHNNKYPQRLTLRASSQMVDCIHFRFLLAILLLSCCKMLSWVKGSVLFLRTAYDSTFISKLKGLIEKKKDFACS